MIDPSSIELSNFLTTWYGPPNRQVVTMPEQYKNLPSPLQNWHALAARWTVPLVRNKKLLSPEEMITKNGKIIFMADPGDAIWGFDPENPATVYEGRLYGDWIQLRESLTDFLIHNAVNEAAYNAPYTKSCECVNNDHLAQILAPMTEVAFEGWYWPRTGHRIFASESLIADVGPAMEDVEPWGNKPGFSEVQVGAIAASSLEYLVAIPGTEWY
jgi:hypothetical protein